MAKSEDCSSPLVWDPIGPSREKTDAALIAIKTRLKPTEHRASQDTAGAENSLRIHEWVIHRPRDKKALLRKEADGEDEKNKRHNGI